MSFTDNSLNKEIDDLKDETNELKVFFIKHIYNLTNDLINLFI